MKKVLATASPACHAPHACKTSVGGGLRLTPRQQGEIELGYPLPAPRPTERQRAQRRRRVRELQRSNYGAFKFLLKNDIGEVGCRLILGDSR